jgi:hypothetical protein
LESPDELSFDERCSEHFPAPTPQCSFVVTDGIRKFLENFLEKVGHDTLLILAYSMEKSDNKR